MAKLDGKVALITGAAVGLGEGIATAYAKYGAKLIMVDLDPQSFLLRLRRDAYITAAIAGTAIARPVRPDTAEPQPLSVSPSPSVSV